MKTNFLKNKNGPFLPKHQLLQEPYSTEILENSLPTTAKGRILKISPPYRYSFLNDELEQRYTIIKEIKILIIGTHIKKILIIGTIHQVVDYFIQVQFFLQD
jgi:hypothetical protein